jgi:hypothetical protein
LVGINYLLTDCEGHHTLRAPHPDTGVRYKPLNFS